MKMGLTLIAILTLSASIFAGCSRSDTQVQASAESKEWKPAGTVEILTPGAPGGDQDLGARAYARALSDLWGVSAVVTNITGDASALYTIQDSQPDGMRVLYYTDAFILNIANGTVDMKIEDITVTAIAGQLDGQVLVCRRDLGWKNLKDMKAACDAQPDKYITSIAFGKTTQIMGQMLLNAGMKTRLADSDGGADRIAKLLGKFVDTAYSSYDAAKKYIDNGDFVALAIVQENRSNVCPDIPTAIEQGFDVVFPTIHFFLMPPNVPKEILASWNDAIKGLAQNTAFADGLAKTCLGLQAKYVASTDVKPYIDRIVDYVEKYINK
jgi:tripartite-type tricarboxylate transporter receptor subunit TctC